ncbi:MAG: four helix bundle protein [Phycisphaerales bacterium]|nr:four helix bundle protein [Phycisphaerales bacterium]MCI0631328.1 four helix bundle protein [Phycisphaerales bacterium]MCI0674801.1 four helix bundle protein [Phycisphaerales bacterium]
MTVQLVREIAPGNEAWTIGRQLLKSGTAIAANICEADTALTEKEFVQFCNIARREAVEARMWLRLCDDERILPASRLEDPLREVDEVGRILTTIIRRTRGE